MPTTPFAAPVCPGRSRMMTYYVAPHTVLTLHPTPFAWGGCARDLQTSHCYILCRWILWMMCPLQMPCKMRCSSLPSAMPAWYLLSIPLPDAACLCVQQSVQRRTVSEQHRRPAVDLPCGHGRPALPALYRLAVPPVRQSLGDADVTWPCRHRA